MENLLPCGRSINSHSPRPERRRKNSWSNPLFYNHCGRRPARGAVGVRNRKRKIYVQKTVPKILVPVVMVEIKQVEEVADRRIVPGDIGIVVV